MKNLFTYLGMEGRLSRKKFLRQIFVFSLIALIPAAIYLSILKENGHNFYGNIYIPVLLILPIYMIFSISVRRIHDRNKSGLWIALYFFLGPIVGILSELYLYGSLQKVFILFGWSIMLVGLIELGYFAGSNDKNRYGPPVK